MNRLFLVLCLVLGACASQPKPASAPAPATEPARQPFQSTYQAPPSTTTLIRGAVVLTGTGTRLDSADVLMVNGRIEAVGPNLTAPANTQVIDAKDRWVTPGLIDVHSHLGVYASPGVNATQDGNESVDPVTPQRLGRAFRLAAGSRLRNRA